MMLIRVIAATDATNSAEVPPNKLLFVIDIARRKRFWLLGQYSLSSKLAAVGQGREKVLGSLGWLPPLCLKLTVVHSLSNGNKFEEQAQLSFILLKLLIHRSVESTALGRNSVIELLVATLKAIE